MFVTFRSDDASARSSGDETELDQVGFVDVLNRLFFFADDRGDRTYAGRSAAEFFDDSSEHVTVGRFEAKRIDFEETECLTGRSSINLVFAVDLSVVADALQDAVGDARGLTAGMGNDIGTGVIEFDPEDAGGTENDTFDFCRRIELESVRGTETVAERIRE